MNRRSLDLQGFPTEKKTGNSPLYKVRSDTHSPAPMTFAVIDWLSISINLLLVIFVIVCLLMTLIILMQRPKQEGLGAAFGGGVTDQVFGARTTNVLQRGTVYLGSLFFVLSLALAVLIGQKNKTVSTVTQADTAAKVEEAKPEKAPETVVPKSLQEELPPAEPTPVETPAPAEVPADAPKEITVAPEATPATPAAPVETTPTDTAPPAEPAAPAPSDAPAAPETEEKPADN
jgi:preprotein translocase subunit SecG